MTKREELNNLINEAINEKAFPSANYAIIFKNKIIMNSLGNRSLIPCVEPNSIDTIYDMASLTKIISTTTAALKLIEKGKLRLYASVQKYIPEFKYSNVTVWNLMTHTSGLPEGVSNLFSLKSSEDVWEKIYNLELKYPTGEDIQYSDVGYILLGKIIENITKKKLNDFVNEEIFAKLKMTNTCYLPQNPSLCAPTEERDDIFFHGVVRGVVHDETAYLLGGVAGHAGLFSNIIDVSRFLQMILNEGVFENQQFLSKATIDLLYTPQVETKKGVSIVDERRSLGWINRGAASSAGELTSLDTILHTGFTGTNIWVDRKNEVAFALLTNRVHPSRKNTLHLDARARIANFIIANLDDIKNNK